MKIYIDFDKLQITKIVQDVMYKGDVLSNAFELLFYNCSDTSWYATMSQLAPNGRQAGDFAVDALEEGESQTVIEDDITYLRYKFTIGAGWVLVKGKSEFFIWKNTVTPMTRKCIGKVVVTLNESTETYFIDDPTFNPAVKEYCDNLKDEIQEDLEGQLEEAVAEQNDAIAELGNGSPKYFDTASNIGSCTTDKGLAVATDTGYLFYWNTTSSSTTKYTNSGVLYNSLASYTKHDGTQLKDSDGNNFYPNISDDIKFLWGNLSEQAFNPANVVDIKASVQSSTIAASDLTSTIFIPLVENDTIVFDRLIDNPYVLVIGFSNGNEVGANVVQQLVICSGGVEYISAKRIKIFHHPIVRYFICVTKTEGVSLIICINIYSVKHAFFIIKTTK